MKSEGKLSSLVSILSVLMMTASCLVVLPAAGGEQRNPGLDAAAVGFATHKDIDDPLQAAAPYYPPVNTTVTATVKNVGDVAITSPFPVGMEVGKGIPETRFFADAEGASMPSGWSVTNFSNNRWHLTNRTFTSATHSAWCGIDGQAAVQYGGGWAESITTAASITVPGGSNPTLMFNQLYSTKLNTDGGYVEIQDMSVSPATWDRQDSLNWSFTSANYPGTTATPNPAGTQDTGCFCGDSNGWQVARIDLTHYQGSSIQFRFIFSSSQTSSGQYYGWYIDDVKVTDGTDTPFQDDFEGGMGNWNVANMRGAAQTSWGQFAEANPGYNYSSTKCFSNRDPTNNAYFDSEDSALVTPSISLAGVTNARLYFENKMQSQASNDGGFVEVQKGGSGEWYFLRPYLVPGGYLGSLDGKSPYIGEAYSGSMVNWSKATFDLSPYVGGTVKVRFHFFANDDGTTGTGWYIDEVKVVAWNFIVSDTPTLNAPALAIQQTANLNFNFNLTVEGFYSFKLKTTLPGDTVSTNDVTYIIIEVRKVLLLDMTFDLSPVNIIHGRKADIGLRVENKGNMPNDITLRVVYPPSPATWNITLNRTNFTIPVGVKAPVDLQVTPPVDESSGNYLIRVNATSKLNASVFVENYVTIVVTNTAPAANAGPSRTDRVYRVVLFDGTQSTDPENDPLNYSWDFGDGSPLAYGGKVNHTYLTAGKYNVTLNVSDGGPGSYSTANTQIVITDDPPRPTIMVDTRPDNGTFQIDTAVVFNGTRSGDEAPDLLSYEWDFGDGAERETAPVVSHNYTVGGTFNVTLTVWDAGNQTAVSDPYTLRINNPPVAKIASPPNNAFFLTTDDIIFSSNGSFDPDGDPLTFVWTDNLMPGVVLSNSASFSRRFNLTGSHLIQLTVYDGHGISSYGYAIGTIDVRERTNVPPKLEKGAVDPKEGDEGVAVFKYTVRYSDDNNDPPDYMNVIIDGNRNAPQFMVAADPLDNNYSDGKDYYFTAPASLLKGDESPHNFTFETADKHGSGRIATETFDGPLVKWRRYVGKDSWMPDAVNGWVYLTGGYRTFLSGVNVTPPELLSGKQSLGWAFIMNTTAPQDRWYWSNITIKYSGMNYSQLNESTLKIYWSVDGQPWTQVPTSGLDVDGQFLWMNVTRSSAKYVVFGTPLPIIHNNTGNGTKPKEEMPWATIGVVVAVAAVGAGAAVFVVLRRKKKAPEEPTYGQRVDYVPAETGARKEAKPAIVEEAPNVEDSAGESVKVFRPAGGEVAIFRPGEGKKTKVFRPGGTDEKVVAAPGSEEEEKIFKPEQKDVEEGESAEGPVVQEEAVTPKVVEYSDEKPPEDEEEDEMPGARPAEEEVEEAEGKKPIEKPKQEKDDEESLDDLLDDLNK